MDVHGKVSEVARELALQVGRGQFLDAAFCLSERYGIGSTGCVLLFPFVLCLYCCRRALASSFHVTIVLSVGVTCLHVQWRCATLFSGHFAPSTALACCHTALCAAVQRGQFLAGTFVAASELLVSSSHVTFALSAWSYAETALRTVRGQSGPFHLSEARESEAVPLARQHFVLRVRPPCSFQMRAQRRFPGSR